VNSTGIWGRACGQQVIAWERTKAVDGNTISYNSEISSFKSNIKNLDFKISNKKR